MKRLLTSAPFNVLHPYDELHPDVASPGRYATARKCKQERLLHDSNWKQTGALREQCRQRFSFLQPTFCAKCSRTRTARAGDYTDQPEGIKQPRCLFYLPRQFSNHSGIIHVLPSQSLEPLGEHVTSECFRPLGSFSGGLSFALRPELCYTRTRLPASFPGLSQ